MSGPARKIDELCQYLIGQSVKVRVRSGKVYTGILHHATTQGGFSVVLKMAKVDSDVFEELPISAQDFSDMQIDDNQPAAATPAPSVASSKADPFKTDSEISGGTNQGEDRALERWDDGLDDPKASALLMGLEDDKDVEFDQFKVNERKFGVKSTYHESLDQYTTKLDKNSDWYKERVHSATLKANQIKNAPTNNPHLKEERTGKLLSGDGDEEDRYSAVVRSPNNNNKNNKSTPAQTPPNQSPSGKQSAPGSSGKKYVLPQHRNRGPEEQLNTSAEQKNDRDTKPEPEPETTQPDAKQEGDPTKSTPEKDGKQEKPFATRKNESPMRSRTILPIKKNSPRDNSPVDALGLERTVPVVSDEVSENFVRFKSQEEATVKKQKKEEIAEFRNFSAEIENKRRSSGADREKAAAAQDKKEIGLRATATEFKPQSASTFQPFVPRGGPVPSFTPKPVEAGGMQWGGGHQPAYPKMGPPPMAFPMAHPGYPPMGPPRGPYMAPHPIYPHPPPSGPPTFVPHSNPHPAPAHASPVHSAPTSQPTPPSKPLTLKPTSSTFVPGSGMTFVPGSGLVPTAVAPVVAPAAPSGSSTAATTPAAGASPSSTTTQQATTEKPQQQ